MLATRGVLLTPANAWPALLSLLFLTGCLSPESDPLTEIVVAVSADSEVLARLNQLSVRVYPKDAGDGTEPVSRADYPLTTDSGIQLPLTFGIERQSASEFLLVIAGHSAWDGPIVVERKVFASFKHNARSLLRVHLTSTCYDHPCESLAMTCGAFGQCEATAFAETLPYVAGREFEVDHVDSGGVSEGDAGGACSDGGCSSPHCIEGACQPGGQCIEQGDTFECDCGEGFTGTGTQACASAVYCPEDACAPHGECIDQPEWYCACETGFSGPNCEVDSCAFVSCARGQKCERTLEGPVCTACSDGFFGVACELDICAKENNPCLHGGACTGLPGALAACDCAGTGYEGATCESVDVCSLCTDSDYPCIEPAVQTNPPSYTCRGQFAEWPMPDAVVGAKVAPIYDTDTVAGVTIDQVTQLWWQRVLPGTAGSAEASYAGCQYNTTCTKAEAISYCEGLTLGSRSDWRLPSKIELETILDHTHKGPSINPAAFPNTPSTSFWTVSRSQWAGQSWTVNFASGRSADAQPSIGYRPRCVRSSATVPFGAPGDRYVVDSAANTVRDTRTGLVWQRGTSADYIGGPGAKTYCTGLGGGYRLPTVKELLTIVDPTKMSPAVPAVFSLPGNAHPSSWSATVDPEAVQYQWSLSSSGSTQSNDTGVGYVMYARCVR